MLVFLLTFCCFLYNGTKVIADRFYIFDVGKGNCQLAIFEEENIGILYDCGSISGKKPAKFFSTITEEKWYKIYQKQTEKREIPTNFVFEEDLDSTDEELQNLKTEENSKSDGNTSENKNSQMSISFMDDNVKPSIGSDLTDLNHLFIILSHPEQDHINLINSTTIPSEIPITVLCEGDWFGHNTADVTKVLNFLKERSNTCIDFPFYWGGLVGINEKVSYKKFLEIFIKDDNNFTKTLKLCNGKTIIPSLSLETIYDVILRNADKRNHFKSFTDILYVDDYSYVYNPLFQTLQNIKIAHINLPFNDVNSQSAIVEIKMPKLGMQFFLTGDASNETFARIVEKNENFFKKAEGYTSLVMLPHHGSIKNESIWIYELFQPDIIGISAGYKKEDKDNHPSKKLIDSIKYLTSFFNKFETTINRNFLVIFENQKAYLRKVENTFIPYVCTNFLGTIKIDEEGFWGRFSNIVEYKNKSYSIDFNKNAKIEYELFAEDELLIEKDSKLYFPLKVKTKKDLDCFYLYEAIELEEDHAANKMEEEISELEGKLSEAGYRIQDVPGDGNCAFTSVKVARGNEAFTGKNQPVQELSQAQQTQIKALRNDTADLISQNQKDETTTEFINNLRDLGFWNNGIEDGVGIEVLSFVAQAIGQPILVLTQEQDGNYRYWISGTMENPNDSNLTFHEIEVNEIGQTLNKYPNAIKLFHNGNHFQAIVPNS